MLRARTSECRGSLPPMTNRVPGYRITTWAKASINSTFNKQFTDDKAACMIVNEDAYFMLLTQPFFKSFTDREQANTATHTEALFALSCDSRADVDAMERQLVSKQHRIKGRGKS